MKSKIRIIYSMSKWSFKYINWRLKTAYPEGWKYAIKHPMIFINDLWNYIKWCQNIENEII